MELCGAKVPDSHAALGQDIGVHLPPMFRFFSGVFASAARSLSILNSVTRQCKR